MKILLTTKVPVLNSINIRDIDKLSVEELIDIKNAYTLPDGMYGDFNDGEDFNKFGIVWMKLKGLGYGN